MKIQWFCCAMVILCQVSHAQTFTEKIVREVTFEKGSNDNALIVANLQGDVKVISYEGDNIRLEVTKSIRAKTDARLEKGKSEIQLGLLDRADTLIFYVQDGCHEFRKNTGQHSGRHRPGWGYESVSRHDCNPGYDYKMDFTVKVPKALNVLATTINDGEVVVENVDGVVKVRNINGSIRLLNLTSQAEAHTINGDVDIEYAVNPDKECRFYTLNGDINALFQPGLSANLRFESFNGNFYTNITSMEHLPLEVEKSDRGEGLRYKISGNRYKVGNGGALLHFETFNGNVYLKEKTR